ncbi:MAG: sirohydrochlorin cobaltochelatase [Candidatus Kentron sp. G]|nr:MAG: sirohydrochlorin cobaltochelatase [Candidatus Kentron sp. G]VFN03628.1 MAG: sirohydrochlorin cobaltochelatase [Candidatus Kentron sp. G]VFN05654.1 MAG: sirohydrochlorin cobaltochelatase [Candidatus Kentron sp. G]
MKDTILLVGHGSRGPDGNRETEQFAEQWRERRPDLDIRLCHIEFADVLLEEGLERAAHDAERIIVAPLIINAAGHVKTEIPEGIAKARGRHPNVEFVYVPHLGACDPILTILKRLLGQAMRELDMPDPVTTGVILLGRGSSDRMANGDVAKMARWLFEASEHELVDIAFTGITHPRLERVVQRQARLGAMQIIILPYYLFTGRLIERIKNQTVNLQRQYPGIRFARAEHFGFEEEIFQLLDERVRDAGKPEAWMPCDGCKLVDGGQLRK